MKSNTTPLRATGAPQRTATKRCAWRNWRIHHARSDDRAIRRTEGPPQVPVGDRGDAPRPRAGGGGIRLLADRQRRRNRRGDRPGGGANAAVRGGWRVAVMNEHALKNAEFSAGDVVCHETAIAVMSVYTDSTGRLVYTTNLRLETDEMILEPDTAYVVTIRQIVYADQEGEAS